MKYVLVLLVVGVAIWLWRRSRHPSEPARGEQVAGRRPPSKGMIQCTVCGVHLPGDEAVGQVNGGLGCPEHVG